LGRRRATIALPAKSRRRRSNFLLECKLHEMERMELFGAKEISGKKRRIALLRKSKFKEKVISLTERALKKRRLALALHRRPNPRRFEEEMFLLKNPKNLKKERRFGDRSSLKIQKKLCSSTLSLRIIN
jgi:hypothetical protein